MNYKTLYRYNKGLWLLMQALMLPMAAIYLSRTPLLTFDIDLLKLLLELVGAFLLILWLIAQALLIMHRFPLKLAPALRLTTGYLLSFIIIWSMEGTPLFAAYTAFYTTLLAIIFCGASLVFHALRESKPTLIQLVITLTVFTTVLCVGAWLFVPLLNGMNYLPFFNIMATLVILGINTVSTTRSLWGKTIFSNVTDDQANQYNAEWERWAAPTIITLILSATAALLIFSILMD
jgi:hypothetical protein